MNRQEVWLQLILMAICASHARTKAQSTYGIRANVPFDFIVGDKTIPAGKITARGMIPCDSGPVSINNFDRGQHTFRLARKLMSSSSSAQAKLLFHKYGNRYYLSQVLIPGNKTWEVSKSKTERAMERESSITSTSKPEVVTVVAEMQ